MKTTKIIFSILLMGSALSLNSCNKERCVTCTFTEHNSGISESKTYCGTDSEIAAEDKEYKDLASEANQQQPDKYYTGSCE